VAAGWWRRGEARRWGEALGEVRWRDDGARCGTERGPTRESGRGDGEQDCLPSERKEIVSMIASRAR